MLTCPPDDRSLLERIGRDDTEALEGLMNRYWAPLGIADQLPAKTEPERAAHQALATFTASGFGYFLEQSTRPQTIGYSLLDSPIGLAVVAGP